jgi:hypothetical protein
MKNIDGRRHSGYLTYEAGVNPDLVAICRCTGFQSLGEWRKK